MHPAVLCVLVLAAISECVSERIFSDIALDMFPVRLEFHRFARISGSGS